MKNPYFIKLLTMVSLVLTMGGLTSCENEMEEPNGGQVQLLSFGPTGAKHGEEIRFIGYNLHKVESIDLPSVSVSKEQFLEQTSELIRLIVPEAATEGRVVLHVANSEPITSKTVLSFEVPVTITSVTQEARPGSNITITGSKLNWVTGVLFPEVADTVKQFVSQTATELVVQVPASAQKGRLIILTGGTEPLAIETEEDFIVSLPAVTSLDPNPVKHGQNVTLNGTNLDLLKEVVFPGGTRDSVFVSQTATAVVVKVPDDATEGILTLVAKNSLVEVSTTVELSLILPVVTALGPNPIDPGANLTITGTNLDQVKSVTFTGGAKVSSFVSKSATQIVLTVPDNALKGALTLVTTVDYEVQTQLEVEIKGDLPPLPPVAYTLYGDARGDGWNDWGWGGPSVWDSREIVRQGEMAAKKTFDGSYDAIRVHNDTPLSTSGYTEITFSVFGTPGTGGKEMNFIINEAWGAPYKFNIVEGEWKTYIVKLSDLGNPSTINDVLFQSAGWAGTVHYDHIGLR